MEKEGRRHPQVYIRLKNKPKQNPKWSWKITGTAGERKRGDGTLESEMELIRCETEHQEIKNNLIGSSQTFVWLSI